jgi:pimeloyl-ACP methyl ester carboxylesterase
MSEIHPFIFAAPEHALSDLKNRLAATRWPERETPNDWSQGVPLAYLQEICAYWREEYDWRRCETRLNYWPQFLTNLQGLAIQFMHVRSPVPNALPLLITHGWPGSVVEFLKVVGPLTDPAAHGGDPRDAFHLVCPTLPGFGFSGKPTAPGWNIQRIGQAWGELMARLGYARYVAQGGDWGSMVTHSMALTETAHCAGIHVNMPLVTPTADSRSNLTAFEQAAIAGGKHYWEWDSGYSKQQSTRPQTLGYGLVDSPSGQAAWILEKFWAWTDCNGYPENALSRDELLDNIMFYWLPAAAASSARLYWESFGRMASPQEPIHLPVGVSIYPHEIFRPSRRWAEARYTNLTHYNVLDKGGHFAAFEQPEIFVDEVRSAFRALR